MRIKMLMAVAAAVAVGLTPSMVSAAPDGTAPLLGAAGSGGYIVVMKDGVSAATADDVARRAGAVVGHRYTATITGFSARLTAAGLDAVRRHPAVAYVEPDTVVEVDTTAVPGVTATGSQSPVPSWGLDRIDQRYLPLNNTYGWLSTGRGVRVYMLGTGTQANHPDLSPRVVGGYDFVDNDANPDDCNGHGTAIAGIVGGRTYGVAKEVTMVPVRVMNCSGSGSISGVIAGIDWITRSVVRPATAVMPLGSSANTSVDDAVNRSLAAGISYSVAAGGSNADACLTSPARVPGALTVAATDRNDVRASFTSYGPCVDLFAPGVSITTTWLAGGTTTLSGTSWSAAYVSGAAALYLEFHPSATAQQVHDAINLNATVGVVQNVPPNTPNRLLYSRLT